MHENDKNNFYVDNLIVSDDDNSKLMYIYKMAVTRLPEGNFSLRSCDSNSKELKALMEKNNSLTQHNSKFERVLGYNYDPNKDLLNITTSSIDKGDKTKRSILAQSAKVFDPLSLYAPITVKSKRQTRLSLNYSEHNPSRVQRYALLLNFLITPFRLLTHYLPTRLAAQTQTIFSMLQIKTIPKNTFRLSASYFFILPLLPYKLSEEVTKHKHVTTNNKTSG